DDRLRMPQFQFSRSRKHKDESDEEFAVRQTWEEAHAREAVMTFVLGLVAEPVSLKYVNTPGPEKLAIVKGRQVLDRFNCAGCHQIQPGIYEFKPSDGAIARLEDNYKTAASQFAADHFFANHNAWAGLPSALPDRMTAFAVNPRELKKEDNDELPEDML